MKKNKDGSNLSYYGKLLFFDADVVQSADVIHLSHWPIVAL